VSITHINSLSACPVDDWKPVEDQHQANAMPRGGLVASRSDAAHGFYQRFYSMHFSIARSLGGRASSLPTRTVVFLVLGRSAAHQSARRTISSSSCIFTVGNFLRGRQLQQVNKTEGFSLACHRRKSTEPLFFVCGARKCNRSSSQRTDELTTPIQSI